MYVISFSFIKNPPWTILSPNGAATGVYFSMLNVMSEKLNFTYRVTPPKTTGSLSNQQYKEMTTQLQQNEAFMAITPFVMAEKVNEELILSESVNLQEYAIMYKRPNELSRLILFVRPYSSFVSICSLYADRYLLGFIVPFT